MGSKINIIPLLETISVLCIKPCCNSSGVWATSTLKLISPFNSVLTIKGVVGFASGALPQASKSNVANKVYDNLRMFFVLQR